MKSLVSAAIQGCRLVRFEYDGRTRTVEPHRLIRTEKNEDALLAWQVTPIVAKGRNWQVFNLKKIYGFLVLDKTFQTVAGERELPAEIFASPQLVDMSPESEVEPEGEHH